MKTNNYTKRMNKMKKIKKNKIYQMIIYNNKKLTIKQHNIKKI